MDRSDVIIASNRGPVGFQRDADGAVTGSRGGGGLVSAMSGIATDGSVLWVCAALSDVDREIAVASPDGRLDLGDHAEYGPVQMLPIDAATLSAAYNTIANTTLWYAHHHLFDPANPPIFDGAWRDDWEAYIAYNVAFADAIAASSADGARILVQDYHLALLPAMLRERRADVRIGHFTHTPWAAPEVFGRLPADIARAVIVGMLGADSVGFHSSRWARDFIDCCLATIDAESDGNSVRYDGTDTAVRVHPLGVDPGPLRARAAQPDVAAKRVELTAAIGDRATIVRVDRTEPSKNIVRGLEAFRELLVRHPEHRERVVHLALEYPSRQDIADYRRYTELVRSTAARINTELGTADWTPIWLEIRNDYAMSLAALQVGDVLLVNPVRDGMNLVAKEGSLLTDVSVLILSTEAGAADELEPYAVMVDPFDIDATAEAMHAALTMPAAERIRRHAGLSTAAAALPPQAWLQQQLAALNNVSARSVAPATPAADKSEGE